MNLGHDEGNDSDDSFACDSEDENDKTLEENDAIEQEVDAQQTNLTPKASVDGMLCLLYTSPSPRDKRQSRMPSSA